ncbi:MAG TPA: hypothetical protein VGH25_12975, partial [Dongiaceae bacterium]
MGRSVDLSDVEIVTEESSGSALSWSAIIGGAVAAASVTLILLSLGAGLGFASLSPWSKVGASATTFAVTTAIWFVVVQWLSSAFGGYLAGRLRSKWVGIHTDEGVFRDTAHGILAWALATVVAALLLSSAVAAAIGGTARTAAQIGAGAAQGAGEYAAAQAGPRGPGMGPDLGMGYLTDGLFRTDHPDHAAHAAGSPRRIRADPADRPWREWSLGRRQGLSGAACRRQYGCRSGDGS